jgi:molybdopterin molybdotransferase
LKMTMISVEEALSKVLNLINTLETEEKPILKSLGQVLAEDVYAPFNVPPKDNSAMDGYAVNFESIAGARNNNPKILHVTGNLPAGADTELRIEKGAAARIMTGAFVPDGTDVVVPFEETDEVERRSSELNPDEIGILTELPVGSNIRMSGEDIKKGELVLGKGKLLLPADIGMLASMGRKTISVFRRPRVAIISTGDEIVDVDQPLVSGKIYNSNTYSLAALVLHYGGIPKILGIVKDEIKQVTDTLRRGFDCDLILTSGGVSLGDFDVVKDVLTVEGDISFWRVCMKPGKPIAFGVFNAEDGKVVPHLGLPGNPVSAMITFEIFVRPAMLKMMGRIDLDKQEIEAIMEDSVVNTDGRRIFARVIVEKRDDIYFVRLTGPQGSGILKSMVQADGLAIIPEIVDEVKPGETVKVLLLNRN